MVSQERYVVSQSFNGRAVRRRAGVSIWTKGYVSVMVTPNGEVCGGCCLPYG